MAKANFSACLAHVLASEGGYVDHTKDPGGATNMGITLATLQEWRGRPIAKTDVRDLTRDEAAAIYRAKYWNKVKGDDLPAGLDLDGFRCGGEFRHLSRRQMAPERRRSRTRRPHRPQYYRACQKA